MCSSKDDYEKVMSAATSAFKSWRTVPAPKRGEMVRQFGDKLRTHKEALESWFPMKWVSLIKRAWVRFKK